MPAKQAKSNPDTAGRSPKDYETLLRLVYERVWELWRDDLRRSRERGGKIGKR